MKLDRVSSRYPFYDVEASGLMRGSFPVDIGWSLYGQSSSVLIRPADMWDEEKWDEVAQSIHGISIPIFAATARMSVRAARILNTVLRGETVYCDSPERDTEWTDMVFAAAGTRREFRIASIGPLLGGLGVRSPEAYASFDASAKTHPPDGVALDGVKHLIAVVDRLEDQE